MKSRFLIFPALILFAFTGCHDSPEFKSVTTRSQNFAVLSQTTNASRLAQIKSLLKESTEVKNVKPDFKFRIDIVTAEGSSRWLYSADGYFTMLTKQKTPLYRLKEYETLNRILGIKSNHP